MSCKPVRSVLAVIWFGLFCSSFLLAQDEDPFGERSQTPPASQTNKPARQEDPFGSIPTNESKSKAQENPFQDNAQPVKPDEIQAKQLSLEQPVEKKPAKNFATEESPFDQRFWKYLLANNYKNWAPVPGTSGDFYPGQSPHGELLKMYLNRTAAGNLDTLPNGSVIIKENYGPDRTLMAITVMYRSEGFYKDGGDWYWIKYNPDGTTARGPADQGAQKIMGAAQGCIECHSSAEGNDFTFFND